MMPSVPKIKWRRWLDD